MVAVELWRYGVVDFWQNTILWPWHGGFHKTAFGGHYFRGGMVVPVAMAEIVAKSPKI